MSPSIQGHVAATATILIWGMTFISTKLLLEDFLPVEILTLRFLLGFVCLLALCPRILPYAGWRRELWMAAAGFCGIFLYYFLENMALCRTLAANVGVIMCLSPLLTALLGRLLGQQGPERFFPFLLDFAVAMTGVCLISLGGVDFGRHAGGDMLALLAALVWAVYSLLMQRIGRFGYSPLHTTQRTFFYGLLGMLPGFFCQSHAASLFLRLQSLSAVGHLVFLGAGACAFCFVSWNVALHTLGAVRTSAYIYLVPVVTVVTAFFVLDESLSIPALMGCLLILLRGFSSSRPS